MVAALQERGSTQTNKEAREEIREMADRLRNKTAIEAQYALHLLSGWRLERVMD